MTYSKTAHNLLVNKLVRNPKVILLIMCIVLVVFSLPARIYMLQDLPPLIIDEPAYLRDIQDMIKKGDYNPARPQWDGSQAYLDYYLSLFFILFLKMDGLFAVRLSSVLYSLIGVIAFFFITRLYTNNKIAFLTALMFSSSYFYLEFSRVGWNVIHALSLGLVCLLFTLLDTKGNRAAVLYSLLAGIFASLCFYSYRGGGMYIACCFLIYIVSFYKNKNKKTAVQSAVFTLSFFALSTPWIISIIQNWEFYMLRHNIVSIFEVKLPYLGRDTWTKVFLYQIAMTVRSWIYMIPIFSNGGHIENQRYLPLVVPILNALLIPFYWIGIILMIKKYKSFYPFLFIFIAGLISSQVFTVYPPNGARGLIVLPVIYLSLAIALFKLQKNYAHKKYISVIYAVFALLVCSTDILFYFYWMTWIKVMP